jgi:hypothetical protein
VARGKHGKNYEGIKVCFGRPEWKGILEDLGMHVLKGVLNRETGRGLYSCWLRVGSGVELL